MTKPHSTQAMIIVLGLVGLSSNAAERSTPPSETASETQVTYTTREQLASELSATIAASADPAVAPVGVTQQYSINEVRRGKKGVPAVHPGWTELHFVLDGSATFVTGGKLVISGAGVASRIEGGVSRTIKRGDAIIVPPNTPHWYKDVHPSVTYLEVRFVSSDK